MFRTKSRSERAADQARAHSAIIKDQAAGLRERVSPAAASAIAASAIAAESARHWAAPRTESAKDWAAPRVDAAKHWAGPRLEKARDRSVEVAAPRVEHAAESLAPKVDAARDKIVDEVLPRLVEALTAAAAAAAIKTEAAHDRSEEVLAAVGKKARTKQHTGRKRKTLLVLGVISAAAGAGYAAWRRGQPTDDPWATATATGSASTTPSGSRLGGGDASGGLGAGSLASQSADVDTPVSDGEASVVSSDSPPPAPSGLEDGSAGRALDDAGTAEIPGVPSTGEESASEAEGDPQPESRRSPGGGAANKD